MIFVLAESPQELAARYSAILETITFNPARFGELCDDDLGFCRDHADAKVLWLTRCMDKLDHTDAEREAAIAAAIACDSAMLERRATVAIARMQAGQTPNLRDYAAWWVSECAIKEQLACELQRRASPMN